MTWEELKEKAKEMGYEIVTYMTVKQEQKDAICGEYITFKPDGSIWFNDDCGGAYRAYTDKSYDKMLMIMRGLE